MTTDFQTAEAHTILPVERLGDTLVVVPHGDLGGYSSHAFLGEFQRVEQLLSDQTLKNLIIDLGGSRYFGSEMIGALVALRQKIIERGRVAITDASPDTRAGLELIKADTLFEFIDTRSEAIRKIATLTVGERFHRHRRFLRWMVTLLVLAGVGWGAYASKLGYRVFGSRTARMYEEIARRWERSETGKTKWTASEAWTYKSELLDELTSFDETMQKGRLFSVREDKWLRQAISAFQSHLEVGDDESVESFLRSMRYARHFIRQRTGLAVHQLGPDDISEDEVPPGDSPPSTDKDSSDQENEAGEEHSKRGQSQPSEAVFSPRRHRDPEDATTLFDDPKGLLFSDVNSGLEAAKPQAPDIAILSLRVSASPW